MPYPEEEPTSANPQLAHMLATIDIVLTDLKNKIGEIDD